jgi:hypothetical protein
MSGKCQNKKCRNTAARLVQVSGYVNGKYMKVSICPHCAVNMLPAVFNSLTIATKEYFLKEILGDKTNANET